MRRITTEEWLKRAKKVHGDRYDYSHVKYVTHKDLVKIICKKHGFFEQTPHNHAYGQNCPDCNSERKRNTTQGFILKARKVHGDRYDYSQVEYVNNREKVNIICERHGSFYQTPSNHLQGQNCPICSFIIRIEKIKKCVEE